MRLFRRRILALVILVSTLALLCLVATGIVRVRNVYAQNEASNVDTHFETVRGELVGFYGSEVVSHSALILGLIVAIPTTLPIILSFLKSKNVLFCITGVLILALFFTLIPYTVGRLIYWSSSSAFVMHSTRSGILDATGINITTENPNVCMWAIIQFAENQTLQYKDWWNLWNVLPILFHPNNIIWISIYFVVSAAVLYIALHVYNHRKAKEIFETANIASAY